MFVCIIAAMTRGRVLGYKGKLPWHIPEEIKLFRETTEGHTIIMGRKTYESYGSKPLPNRHNILVSRSIASAPGMDVCATIDDAIAKARSYGGDIFIIGGGEIFAQAVKVADRMYLSYVDGEYEGDTFFPEFDERQWLVESRVRYNGFERVVYVRRKEGSGNQKG